MVRRLSFETPIPTRQIEKQRVNVTVKMLSYVVRKTKRAVLALFSSFLIWAFVTTFLEGISTPFQLNKIPNQLQNKNIQVLIAHPDDEVMFFSPSIIELTKPKYHNHVSLTCLSVGNDQGLGQIRNDELVRSLNILGIKDYEIIDDETKFKDSMELEWDAQEVNNYISEDTDVILTFDEFGISNHPNHKSLYNGAILSNKTIFALKSWRSSEKYSSTLYTNIQIFIRIINFISHLALSHLSSYQLKDFLPTALLEKLHLTLHQNVHIFADLPSTILGIAAMSNAHHTQMVWFRWGWLILSRYGNANELIQVQ